MRITLPFCDTMSFTTPENRRMIMHSLAKVKRDIRIGFVQDSTHIYIAMDKCGRMHIHTHEPTFNQYCWYVIGQYKQSYMIGSNVYQKQAEKSLVKLTYAEYDELLEAVRHDDDAKIDELISSGRQWHSE